MEQVLIPSKLTNYLKLENYSDLEKVINSGMFAPVFIAGLARSGKTVMVEQVCANNNREMIRVNITEDTDEDDLFGGLRARDGNTVDFDGPVISAMKRGAVLLLDEVDKASSKCMCLQPIMEGSPIYVKYSSEFVIPKPGFNVVATANTKGQGDLRGKFLSSRLLDEAFLDRFTLTIDHEYPPPDVEKKIAKSYIPEGKRVTSIDDQFIDHLIEWAVSIRKMYMEDSGSEIISTGRIIHIMKNYLIFKCPFKAIKLGIARFDDSTKTGFMESFKAQFPYDEGDISPGGTINTRKFMKKIAEEMDFSEFNTRYKMPTTA